MFNQFFLVQVDVFYAWFVQKCWFHPQNGTFLYKKLLKFFSKLRKFQKLRPNFWKTQQNFSKTQLRKRKNSKLWNFMIFDKPLICQKKPGFMIKAIQNCHSIFCMLLNFECLYIHDNIADTILLIGKLHIPLEQRNFKFYFDIFNFSMWCLSAEIWSKRKFPLFSGQSLIRMLASTVHQSNVCRSSSWRM